MDQGLLRFARGVAGRYSQNSLKYYLVKSILYAAALAIWLAAVVIGSGSYVVALLVIFALLFYFLIDIASPVGASLFQAIGSGYANYLFESL